MRAPGFVVVALLVSACGSSAPPKPLPGGLPPEYERPRGYDGDIGEEPPPPAPAPAPTPPAP